jgi:hypothetical protein
MCGNTKDSSFTGVEFQFWLRLRAFNPPIAFDSPTALTRRSTAAMNATARPSSIRRRSLTFGGGAMAALPPTDSAALSKSPQKVAKKPQNEP